MRRVAIFLLFALLASGCKRADGLDNGGGEDALEGGICFEEGIYPDKNWDAVESAIEIDCIPDKETAVRTAVVLLQIESRKD